jgi:hypothetical protein
MKVKVSRTVKAAFGKTWKKQVACLIEDAQAASEGKAAEFVAAAEMSIHIKVSKKGAMVTARPDFLPELDECEIRVQGEPR